LSGRAETAQCPALAPQFPNGGSLALHQPSGGRALSILAIGSSSTEGVAASSAGRTYPAQLALQLAERYHVKADVQNAGIGGEIASQTLVRLKAALEKQAPDLVIWQVGTNDAMTGVDLTGFKEIVDAGIYVVQGRHVPLIIVDPQIPPSRIDDVKFARYADVIEAEAARLRVPVVSRYQMMKALIAANRDGWRALQSGDGVHMNDLGYACLARSLVEPIAESLKGPPPVAKALTGTTSAGL
jgi:acyl-CoA thioesterase I